MSFSLSIVDGDLDLRGSSIAIVHGAEKLKQDVSIWLRERYGSDRFHTNYGSVLDSFIGSVISDYTKSEVQSEVLRVLQNYQSVQLRRLKENPQLLSAAEIMASIDSIDVTINYDMVNVVIRFTTASNTSGSLSVGASI